MPPPVTYMGRATGSMPVPTPSPPASGGQRRKGSEVTPAGEGVEMAWTAMLFGVAHSGHITTYSTPPITVAAAVVI